MKKAGYLALLIVGVTASFLAGRHFSSRKSETAARGHRILYYQDPMHPAYRSDHPGIAPDCGMQLEPVYAYGNASPSQSSNSLGDGLVHITAEQQRMIGLQTAAVERSSTTMNMRLPARVAADETRSYRIIAAVDGWIRQAYGTTGSFVKKDERLATFYSPEFLAPQQSFISAVERPGSQNADLAVPSGINKPGIQSYIDRLSNLGMSDFQIRELAATKQTAHEIYIVSPANGFIMARNVSADQRFERGMELYRVADLSRVWIVADVFENEIQYFRPGTMATAILPQTHRTLRARVTEALPQLDPATLSLKIRLEAANPGFELRPDMFVEVELPTKAPAGLSVMADAVVDSGMSQRVFVDKGDGSFEPRFVETGAHFGDRVQITKGLEEGERVIVAGTFLVDSESRLHVNPAGGDKSPNLNARVCETASTQAKAKLPATVSSQFVTDPACRMGVDPAKAISEGHTLAYKGETYYFCSAGCLNKFHKAPDRYLASNQAGGRP